MLERLLWNICNEHLNLVPKAYADADDWSCIFIYARENTALELYMVNQRLAEIYT